MRKRMRRGDALHLSEDELAFYDALEVNGQCGQVLGEPTLVKIARELVETVKKNVTMIGQFAKMFAPSCASS